MIASEIYVNDSLELVHPNVERDAQISLSWLKASKIRPLMRLMNVRIDDNYQPNITDEIARITNFIERQDQIVWMIKRSNAVIGSIWADIVRTDHLEPPVVCLMLGNENSRQSGVGKLATTGVLNFLSGEGYEKAYAGAVLVNNTPAINMLNSLNYQKFGVPRLNEENEFIQDFVVDLSNSDLRSSK